MSLNEFDYQNQEMKVQISKWKEEKRLQKYSYVDKRMKNGDRYIGQWDLKGECFEGQGTFKWLSGDYYEGQWKGGMQHGYGLYVTSKMQY